MPIESYTVGLPASGTSLGQAWIREACDSLAGSLVKIDHCLAQLDNRQVAWRPVESLNSVHNLLLHLAGNLRQWIVHGITGARDARDRPSEFADRTPRPIDELRQRIHAAVDESITALHTLDEGRLLDRRRIQGFETTLLTAIFDAVTHFSGHTQQIVFITRLQLGERYHFQWQPTTAEQGA